MKEMRRREESIWFRAGYNSFVKEQFTINRYMMPYGGSERLQRKYREGYSLARIDERNLKNYIVWWFFTVLHQSECFSFYCAACLV